MLPVLGLISALLALPGGHSQTMVRTSRLGDWRMEARTDRFSGAVSCKLFKGASSSPYIAYAHASLAFRFSPRLSTLDADYRVDGAPAKAWSWVYPQLVQLHAMPPAANLENPTGGLVVLPVAELASARTVSIRPSRTSQPRIFLVANVANALLQAQALGCTSDDDFTR